MSLTFTLTKHSSELSSTLFPPVPLNDGKYEIGLLSFDTYNSIPNIDEKNNAFYFGDGQVAHIPAGTYEVDAILKYMQERIHEYKHILVYKSNLNTFKTSIKCSVDIDFSKPNNIGSLLGFHSRVLKANIEHTSDKIVDIFGVNIIDIQCNISSGSYTNGVPTRSLHAFSSKVGAGYRIHEVPTDVIYLPVDVELLDNLYVKIVDQAGRLVNFRNERITVRLHIRKSVT
jgi:hypothetical protein